MKSLHLRNLISGGRSELVQAQERLFTLDRRVEKPLCQTRHITILFVDLQHLVEAEGEQDRGDESEKYGEVVDESGEVELVALVAPLPAHLVYKQPQGEEREEKQERADKEGRQLQAGGGETCFGQRGVD